MKKLSINPWALWPFPVRTFAKRRKYLKYLTLLSLLSFILICTQSTADTVTQLTLNTTTNSPLSTPEQQGFLDRVGKEAFARIGLSLKILALPAERALRDANSGHLDGELARVPGIEKIYKNLLVVPEKLIDIEFTVFSIKQDQIEPGWGGLNNKTVAFLNGWKILEKNVPASAEITKVHSPRQLFNLLKLNRVEYIIYEKWGGIALARSMGISNAVPLNPPLAVRQLNMFLHNKHRQYIEPLSNALKEMKRDGTYERIYESTLAPFASNNEIKK